ncbi:MAG: M13 family metallopeptidase [Actinomycetota bacterium]|nr:M13 family metallopeptidase [Actinomycetota bacterium]
MTNKPLAPTLSSDDIVFDPQDMDTAASPATDFWRWANGGWLDSNPVPPEYSAWGAFHELHTRNEQIVHELLKQASESGAEQGSTTQKVGDFYASGMDTDAIEAAGLDPIQDWLDLIDGIDTVEDLRTAFTELIRIGAGVGWDWHVEPDRTDSSQNLLYINQGGLSLPDRDYYTRTDEQSLELAQSYRDHTTAMFELLGRSQEAATAAAATIWDIELRLAEASNTAVERRDVEATTNKFTRSELAELTPTAMLSEWVEVIGAAQEPAVNIDKPEFFTELDTMFDEIPIASWKSYCVWHLISSVASALPARFEDESFSFWGVKVSGQQVQKPRWKRVVAAVGGGVGQLVSELYVRDNFPPSAKERVEGLVERILVEMKTSIETREWMGEETKHQALEKLAGFGYKIGYPDVWRDYSDLTIGRDSWLTNRLEAREFEFDRNISLLGKPLDPHEWLLPPHIVNAYYWPERNEIVFPAGILQPPFFVADADDAVNFGGIGAVIGHEITHGFDDKGSMYDATGHLRNWWTEDDRIEFDARAKMISDQFDQFEIENGLSVNGALTLGENIADLAGLTLAFSALGRMLDESGRDPIGGLTPEQRFFLSYARVWRMNSTPEYLRLIVNSDPHSPAQFRVTGPLSNLDEFAAAFGIPDGSAAIRPVNERARVW